MLKIVFDLVEAIQPILVPLCFGVAWLFVLLLFWSIFSAVRDAVAKTKQMHQIPCTSCQFFTDDYRLKCTVQPHLANTEKAIDCSDYSPKVHLSIGLKD